MLISKTAKVLITMQNIEYYRKNGYLIETYLDKDKHERVKYGTYIDVLIADLPENSNSKVIVKCDYCGDNITKKYRDYINQRKNSNIMKDCCKNCISQKQNEGYLLKYGTTKKSELSALQIYKYGRKNKYSLLDIKNMCRNKNYTIIYVNSTTLNDIIELKCNKHDCNFATKIRNLEDKTSCNCPICANEKRSLVQAKATIEEAIKICNRKNYTIITNNINNCDDKIDYICNKHCEYGIQQTSLFGLRHYNKNCRLCKMPRQENHWHWNNGISTEREIIMSNYKYQNWRNDVFKRDNYTCQCCGKHGVKLNAHHLYNFSDYPELRLNIDNGITLCENCHSISVKGSFHDVYTQYHNTPEQLYEYITNKRKELGLENQYDSLLFCENWRSNIAQLM